MIMTTTKKSLTMLSLVGLLSPALASPSNAFDLLTGEETGAYHTKFCPAIQEQAKQHNITLNCKNSAGSLDNLEQVLGSPSKFGLAQYDQFALVYANESNKLAYTPIHDDIGSECLFMVTKNKLINNFGDIAASAPYLNFILPPEKSGHAGTFKYLQMIDPSGIGKATKITYAASTSEAISEALKSEDNVTLFVQDPNPKSALFKQVNENEGHFVPVISREILNEEVKGRKVYSPLETEVSNPSFYKSGEKVITACTPIMLFTGKNLRVTDPTQNEEHQKAITALQAIPAKDLRLQEGWWSKLWSSSKALSAKGVEGLLEATDKAKKATSPYITKAKNAAEPYVEKAKETTKDVIEAAKPVLEKAKEKTEEAVEAAKPVLEKAKEKTGEALEKAGEAAKPALEKAKELGKQAIDKAGEMVKGSDEQTPAPQTTEPEADAPVVEKPSEDTPSEGETNLDQPDQNQPDQAPENKDNAPTPY